jgi:hypothetical protein
MEDEFINRLGMFNASSAVLDEPEFSPVWQDQPPLIFTTKVADARAMVAVLQEAQKDQEAGITGAAQEKDREEQELETAAHIMGQALVNYFNAAGQETEAAAVDLTPTEWAKLREQQLLAKSQLVIDSATALTVGPDAAEAAKYGITPAAITELTDERTDFNDIVNAPQVAIAIRKALTKGFRPAFALVERKFKELDGLILQYRKTAPGRALIAAWKAARVIKGPGQGAPAQPAPVPAPAPVA